MISESVSDLEKSGGSAPSICIDVLGQTLKAGSSVTFQPTRSYNTSLERSHQFLNDREV